MNYKDYQEATEKEQQKERNDKQVRDEISFIVGGVLIVVIIALIIWLITNPSVW
jgi:Ca2+/Na+ antiporter